MHVLGSHSLDSYFEAGYAQLQNHDTAFKISSAGGLRLQRATEACSISAGRSRQNKAERLIHSISTGTTSAFPVGRNAIAARAILIVSSTPWAQDCLATGNLYLGLLEQ